MHLSTEIMHFDQYDKRRLADPIHGVLAVQQGRFDK